MARRDAGSDPMHSDVWSGLTADAKAGHLRLEVVVHQGLIKALVKACNVRFTDPDHEDDR